VQACLAGLHELPCLILPVSPQGSIQQLHNAKVEALGWSCVMAAIAVGQEWLKSVAETCPWRYREECCEQLASRRCVLEQYNNKGSRTAKLN
jgi:hypothetical protein